ncbi:MAG: retropepsin-like aspartic protease [Cyanobacteria bacterium P01_D01_bin.56]
MGNIWTMLEKKHLRFFQILCLTVLTACQVESASQLSTSSDTTPPASPTEVVAETAEKAVPEPTPQPASTAYRDAINLASGAVMLGQQATSLDDWSLIVSRWQQAIEKLEQVPTEDTNHGMAQAKLKEYEQNLAQAQQRLKTLQQPPPEIPVARSKVPIIADGTPAAVATSSTLVPIIERHGGTPVIEVTFNGKRYPMILDTGASHTHVPRAMANELGIQVLGQTSVTTASSNRVVVDVGAVSSIRVGNIERTNMPVSIGDTVPIGLLGNDVYEDYDLILQANSVEFRPR